MLGLCSLVALAPAVAAPDAGTLLRQNEQDLKAQPSVPRPPAAPAQPRADVASDAPTAFVRGFVFSGNTLMASDALAAALRDYTERELTLAQIKQAADAVVEAYRQAGWTVRAYVPRQALDDGVVRIHIVEAVFGGAQLQAAPLQRLDGERLVAMAEAIVPKGQPLQARELDRALLLMADLPGISVAGSLVEGQREGETKLLIAASDGPLVNGYALADNQGSRATGADRLSLSLNINSPLRLGDVLTLQALKTQGSDYQRVGYMVPVGLLGWRAGWHASRLDYRVVAAEFATLDAHGTATTAGWDVSYPLLRSPLRHVQFNLSYDNKALRNSANGVANAYGIQVLNASLAASLTDGWAGGGVTTANAALTRGDKSTEGAYTKLNLGISRLQSLSGSLSLYAAASAQRADRNLDSSEKLYLGGASGVRAYPASEAGGSEGSTLTLELRQRLTQQLTLAGLYDHGWIKVNRDNNIASPANPNRYRLQGYGVSLAWQATPAMLLKATLSQRGGGNPAAQANGADGDGTRKVTRLWLSAGMAF